MKKGIRSKIVLIVLLVVAIVIVFEVLTVIFNYKSNEVITDRKSLDLGKIFDKESLKDLSSCNDVAERIGEEMKIVSACESDDECVLGKSSDIVGGLYGSSYSSICCGFAYNKNAYISKLRELVLYQINSRCDESECTCPEVENPVAKCITGICSIS